MWGETNSVSKDLAEFKMHAVQQPGGTYIKSAANVWLHQHLKQQHFSVKSIHFNGGSKVKNENLHVEFNFGDT